MRLPFFQFLYMFFAIPFLLHAESKDQSLNANNDHGFWFTEEATADINDEWSVNVNLEQRWGSACCLLWYQRYEAIFTYDFTKKTRDLLDADQQKLLKGIFAGIGYSQLNRIQRNTKNVFHWVGISRPEIELKIDLCFRDWTFRQRFRVQYICHQASHYRNFFDYRWRLNLDFPWNITCWEIAPYIQNEFFFRENTYSQSNLNGLVGGLFEDRFRVGLRANPIKNFIQTELYWQWRPIKQVPGAQNRWNNTYQYGLLITLML